MKIQVMPWRLENLQATIDGFLASGALLATKVGTAYGKADTSDDPGLYLFAGPLGAWLGLDAPTVATFFFLGLLSLALVVGSWGAWRASRSLPGRVVAIIAFVLLAYFAAGIGDVYTANAAILVALVPWLLVVMRERSPRALLFYAPIAGVLAGTSNLIRSHSGTALALIALTAFALAVWAPARTRAAAAAVLLAMMLISPAGLALAHEQRDDFLATVDQLPPIAASGHPLWHSVYIGLGYVPNDHGITYLDEVGFALVQGRSPGTLSGSPESEAILREEVFRLAQEDPAFVARGIGAKLGVLLGFLLVFANVGLLAMVLARPPWAELVPLLVGLSFTALPGVLAIPVPSYLLGFIAMSTLVGIVGIDSWLAKRAGRVAARPPEA